jgi:hypothetical protein
MAGMADGGRSGVPSEATTTCSQEVGTVRGVGFWVDVVAPNLSADDAETASQLLGNGTQAVSLQPQRRLRDALFSLQLLESSGHLDTLRESRDVAFQT